MTSRQTRSWADFPTGAAMSGLVVMLVLAFIWIPELAHWYVKPAVPTVNAVATARQLPQQSTLDEVAAMHLGAVAMDPTLVISSAEQVLRGSLNVPGFPSMPLTLPFAPAELERGLPVFQLAVASLVSADLLLEAYRMTGREVFLAQARELIVSFARFEAAQWFDRGMMWNDHAIAARAPVLVKFWAHYRVHRQFDPEVGQHVLNLVSRSVQLLAKPSFYAWRTGHGIVSNAAMLQMAAAFPELPEMGNIRQIAAERFSKHLPYWINEEGATLLHSAGYHSPGLLGMVLRLYTLNGLAIAENWWTRYAKAIEFDRQLRRPDNTLPMFGDTMSTPRSLALVTARHQDGTAEPLQVQAQGVPLERFASYPVAGHAVWWDGLADSDPLRASTQTAVTWSYHPGLGHKLADELSLVLWAGGRTWLTNTGYWPYGVAGRDRAESWGASNAPHLLGESKNSVRHTRLLSLGQGEGVSFIDLQRIGPPGFAVRRQIIRLSKLHSWVVLDQSLNAGAQATTTQWTFYPDLSALQLTSDGRYLLQAPDSSQSMQLSFTGSPGHQTALRSGQHSPFAGWVVMDRTPTPAPSIVVTQASQDSWSLASLTTAAAVQKNELLPAVRMAHWTSADDWVARVPTAQGGATLTRTGSQLLLQHADSAAANVVVDLVPQTPPEAELQLVRESVQWASDRYQKFRELISYRRDISAWLIAIFVVQEFAFFFLAPRLGSALRVLRAGSWLLWVMGGVWLSQVYLTVPD